MIVIKANHLFKQSSRLFIIIILLLIGCAGHSNIASRLSEIEPVDFNMTFNPDLRLKEIVINIREASSENIPIHIRKHSFKIALGKISASTFEYAAERFNLDEDQKGNMLKRLKEQQDEIAEIYFDDFDKIIREERYSQNDDNIVTYKTYVAVRAFARLLSERICSLASVLIPFIWESPNLITPMILSRPCEIILAEALGPIIELLENQALIEDHLICKMNIKEHVRKAVLQLATVQDDYKIDFATAYERKVFFDIFTSRADLSAEFFSHVKAGFDLKKFFSINIDEHSKVISLYMPEPEILSIEVIPVITNMEDGWFIEIDEQQINRAIEIAHQRIRDMAIRSGILEKAKDNANMIVYQILAPLISQPFINYKFELYFSQSFYLNSQTPYEN